MTYEHVIKRWERETRYFEARLIQDLFGTWVIKRIWGRKNTRIGQIRSKPVKSYDDGLSLLDTIERQRLSRGYKTMDAH